MKQGGDRGIAQAAHSDPVGDVRERDADCSRDNEAHQQ
ncbi:protein of unknown function [Pararobbsia alpina]